MNDHAILEQIAQNPNCRAVQLADRLDVELEDVQAALAGLIAVGDVTATPGSSPAGAPCQLYDLSEKFRTAAANQPMLAKAVASNYANFRPDLGKVARAIEFVRERSSATSAELHAVLQLAPDEYASSYLNGALSTKRLVKDGKVWTLGVNAGASTPASSDAVKDDKPSSNEQPVADALASGAELGRVEKSGPSNFPGDDVKAMAARRSESRTKLKPDAPESGADLGKREPEPKPALQAPTFLLKPSAEGVDLKALRDALKPPRYRCALWSDGEVEIQRDGVTVASLPRDVADEMGRFLAGLPVERAA